MTSFWVEPSNSTIQTTHSLPNPDCLYLCICKLMSPLSPPSRPLINLCPLFFHMIPHGHFFLIVATTTLVQAFLSHLNCHNCFLIGLVAFGLSSSNPQRSSMTSPKWFFFFFKHKSGHVTCWFQILQQTFPCGQWRNHHFHMLAGEIPHNLTSDSFSGFITHATWSHLSSEHTADNSFHLGLGYPPLQRPVLTTPGLSPQHFMFKLFIGN